MFIESVIILEISLISSPLISLVTHVVGPHFLDPLDKLQNRAIRLITSCGIRAHLFPLYKDLRLLSLRKIYLHNVLLFMYKRHHDILPNMFYSLFTVNRDITGRNTRQSNLLHMPKAVLSVRRRTILFSGVSLRNFFFDRISYDISILSYKCSLKQNPNSSHSLPNIPYW